jgi:hypothetical protein
MHDEQNGAEGHHCVSAELWKKQRAICDQEIPVLPWESFFPGTIKKGAKIE